MCNTEMNDHVHVDLPLSHPGCGTTTLTAFFFCACKRQKQYYHLIKLILQRLDGDVSHITLAILSVLLETVQLLI